MQKNVRKKILSIVTVLTLVLAPLLIVRPAHAALLTSRSVQVLNPQGGATTSYIFGFDINSSNSVGSIKFEFCSNTPLFSTPCTPPTGLDVSLASLDFEAGETGFSMHSATDDNTIVISRTSTVTTPGPSQYVFDNVTNPSAPNDSTYVRISLHSTDDGSGPFVDDGAVVFSTVTSITTTAYVPPFLVFCVGVTIAPDCSSSAGFLVDLGEFDTSAAKTGTSQFAGATNDPDGFSVSVHGTTLTSGNNVIPALNPSAASLPGTSQFGINLRSNTNPSVGSNPTGSGTSAPVSGYGTVNQFRFQPGSVISESNIPTHFTVMTVSYMANISPQQPPGVYSGTFTYTAVADF
ncbi:MAG: hypothetical protein U5K77_03150 [Candidatus Saccharibacteria bacterium]|nr:hypothetical protein [Candidatus Saccharibacteria bacterium]